MVLESVRRWVKWVNQCGADGSGMIMAVFLLALLTAIGVALLFLSQTEMRLSDTDRARKQTFFLAEAGLEAGREQLRQQNMVSGNWTLDDELDTAAGSNDTIEFDSSTIRPIYDANGVPTGFTGTGDDVALQPLTAFGDGWFAAFLTNDVGDGPTLQTDTNERVLITAVGVGRNNSFDIVQAVVGPELLMPLPPAAITMLGPTPDFNDMDDDSSSGGAVHSGDDCNGAGIPGIAAPVVGAVGAAAEATAETGMNIGGEEGGSTYTSSTYNGASTFADLTDPTEPTVLTSLGPIDADWTNCTSVQQILSTLQGAADYFCDERGGDTCVVPATTSSSITFIDGDLNVPAAGDGILVVTGTVDFGDHDWNGIILAVGEGIMIRQGDHASHSGAAVVADISGPDGVFGTGDDCTGGTGGFDTAQYTISAGDEEEGGSARTTYCTNDMLPFFAGARQKVETFRER
ncbi:MAG: hypothetical protein GY716_16485 [bacterium]|nr:hypothetical protein [bacterium]